MEAVEGVSPFPVADSPETIPLESASNPSPHLAKKSRAKILNAAAVSRRADGAPSEMPGERAPSFHGLSMGETPGPERSRGEQREGEDSPVGKP
jgi:hypothetical protein